MPSLRSSPPSPRLRPYVRAYAQRKFGPSDLSVVEPVPAQLEQVLNFELGILPGVLHRQHEVSSPVWIGGAQTSFPGYMDLRPGVESFAIFFEPAGWSQLFSTPMYVITNRLYDAAALMGPCVWDVWNQFVESSSFEDRVAIAEEFLLSRIRLGIHQHPIEKAAAYLFHRQGAVRIPKLAGRDLLGLRQFERRFQRETGTSPKVFARVARFQAALDAKLAAPDRTWVDIAHSFGYHDQMHMIHDFESLGRNSPTQLIVQLGDIRPPALATAA
jgi:AraC-like DNA-binding protein